VSPNLPRAVFGLPAYNGERHLAEAIESLLGQTDRDLAVIVVDDCSTDDTREIALRYAAFDRRVVYERNATRLGMVRNWRRAFELASTRHPEASYFAWASDHDVWHPRWLERLAAALESDPDTVLAYPYGAAIGTMGEPLPPRPRRFETVAISNRRQRLLAAIPGASAGWAVYGLFCVDALRECGPYRAVVAPDRLLIGEISLRGRIRMIDHPLWLRRYRPGETTSHARQRRTLFGRERPPLYSYLPWWLPHACVFFWTLGVRKPRSAEIGRREGITIALQYAMHAWSFASKDLLLRRWRASSTRKVARSTRKVLRRRFRKGGRFYRTVSTRARRLLRTGRTLGRRWIRWLRTRLRSVLRGALPR
jgi:glycosyltransferase involved in cell wall biosynthesis